MLHSAGYRSKATAVGLAREYRSVWQQCLLTLLAIAFMTALAKSSASTASEVENYRVGNDLAVYLGVLPAAIVRGHPKAHPETSTRDGVQAERTNTMLSSRSLTRAAGPGSRMPG